MADTNPGDSGAVFTAVKDLKNLINKAVEIEIMAERVKNHNSAHVLIYILASSFHKLSEQIVNFDFENFVELVADVCGGRDKFKMTVTSDESPPPKWAFRHKDCPWAAVTVLPIENEKCARCYKITNDVGAHGDVDNLDLCGRCAEVIRMLPADHPYYQQPFFTSQEKILK